MMSQLAEHKQCQRCHSCCVLVKLSNVLACWGYHTVNIPLALSHSQNPSVHVLSATHSLHFDGQIMRLTG
jgi:hypothetical protein